MKNKVYEVLLTEKYVEPKSWMNFILEVSKLNGHFKKWSIFVKIENNYIRYFIKTKREMPPVVNTLGEFLLRKVDEKVEVNARVSIPCFITMGYKNILQLYDKFETKRGKRMFLAKINIYSYKKDNYLTTTKLFLKNENEKIVSKKAFWNDVTDYLSIDFDKHARFFYKKDEEKYLDITKTIHIFDSEKNNAILSVDAFPYFQQKSYLNQHSYDFSKHTAIVGASGTGKSKLMSSFIKNIASNSQDKLNYKIVVIDPHASLEDDIGGLESTKVIDFKSIEDSVDLFVNSTEDIIATTEAIMDLFKTIIADQYNSRLERVLRYSIHLLLATEKFDLVNLRKLLVETEFRNKILREAETEELVVSSVIEFFLVDFNKLKTESYQEAISPIISFIDEMQILPVFNNNEKNENLQDTIKENFLTVLSLDQTTLGERMTKTIAGFSMQQVLQLVQMRTLQEHIILVVDEVSVIENPILARFLSEARKYNLSLVLCQQYFEQISEELQKAIFTNVLNYFIFRVSRADAITLEGNMNMEVAVRNSHRIRIKMLSELNDRECIARLCRHGIVLTAFKARTLDFVPVPRIKKRKKSQKVDGDNTVRKKLTNFTIGTVEKVKDIMRSQSTGRRKVTGDGQFTGETGAR